LELTPNPADEPKLAVTLPTTTRGAPGYLQRSKDLRMGIATIAAAPIKPSRQQILRDAHPTHGILVMCRVAHAWRPSLLGREVEDVSRGHDVPQEAKVPNR